MQNHTSLRKVLPLLGLCAIMGPQLAHAGGATVTYTAPTLSFDSAACGAGAQVVTGNTAGSLAQDANASVITWDVQAIENGGAPHTYKQYTTTASATTPIAVNDLVYGNAAAHVTGDTLTVQLVCSASTGTPCSGSFIQPPGGPAVAATTPVVLGSTTYNCPAPVPVNDPKLMALLAALMALAGGFLLFRRGRA